MLHQECLLELVFSMEEDEKQREPVPARWSGVELRPCVSLQLIFSGEQSFWTRARQPFLAASNRAASPLSRSCMSVSPSFTMSSGMLPSRFFLDGSAPCWMEKFDFFIAQFYINIWYIYIYETMCMFRPKTFPSWSSPSQQ